MIEIHADQEYGSASFSFWIIDRRGIDGKSYVIRFGKHHSTLEETIPGEHCEPSFRLGADVGHQFFKQMAELALKRGIKTAQDEKMEGRMAALEAHLADMRRLVFHDEMRGAEALVENLNNEVKALRELVTPVR